MAWGMENMDSGVEWWLMPRMSNWDAVDLALVLAMWVIMMTAMMLPSAAGAYQFTNLKYTCLSRCQSPLSALMTQRRDGLDRALLLGFVQGAFCIGCCWLLMVLLFVLGVMNLLWIAALSLFVLLEK